MIRGDRIYECKWSIEILGKRGTDYTSIGNTSGGILHGEKSEGRGEISALFAIRTTLNIYNILGQEIRTLVDEPKDAGYYTVTWDGKDSQGQNVSSGVYFYRLQAGDFMKTKKMVLMR